jgi:hypothetical protein
MMKREQSQPLRRLRRGHAVCLPLTLVAASVRHHVDRSVHSTCNFLVNVRVELWQITSIIYRYDNIDGCFKMLLMWICECRGGGEV